MVAHLQVSVSDAKGLRLCAGNRQPDTIACLRIIDKDIGPLTAQPLSTILTPRCIRTCDPKFEEGFTLAFPGLHTQATYQLEVSLWDQGGADRSLTNEQNFLGEVILNLSKLAEWDGVAIDQEFDLRAGHHAQSPRPLGKLNMKLKYLSEAAPPSPVGLSLVVYKSWAEWAAMQQKHEQRLLLDLSHCLQTEAERLEFVSSSSGTQQVTFYGQTFFPIVAVVNILTPAARARDQRSPQELETLILSLLKNTSSALYQVESQVREVFVHEYVPPAPARAVAPAANTVPRDAPATAGTRAAAATPTAAASPAPAAVQGPVFKLRPAKDGESEIEVNEAMSGPRRFEVQILRGRNLPKMDNFGTIDGYCNVTFNGMVQKTKTIKNSYSPDWADSFVFEVDDVSKRPAEGLKVVLMDWDRMSKDERVGEVVISADRIWDVLRTQTSWLEEKDRQVFENSKAVVGNNKQPTLLTIKLKCLDPTKDKEDAWKLKLLKEAESLKQAEILKQAESQKHVKLGAGAPPASPPAPPQAIRSAKGPRVLEFTVVRGLHLPKMDRINTIDAFCEIRFGSHPQQRTETKKNTYTPVWNQPFLYNIPDAAVKPEPIVVTVFDWNAVGKNDKVGTIEIPSDQVWDFLQKGSDEEDAIELPIIGDNGRPVVGNDRGVATIYFKARIVESKGAGAPQAAAQPAAVSGRPSISRDEHAEGPRRIELTLIRGQHMPKMDTLGSIDPLCEIRFGSQVFTSNHVKGSYNPVWNEPFMLNIQDVSKVPSAVEVSVFDWNRMGKNTRVGGFVISSDEIWEACKMNIGWQTEKDWPLVNDGGENVIGNDRQVAIISLKVRVMDASPEQRGELQRTNSKLAPVQPPAPPPPAPPAKQTPVKTYKLGATAPPQDQMQFTAEAHARAVQQQWEMEQARMAAYYNAQYQPPPPPQYYQPPPPPPQEYRQNVSDQVFEHEDVFRRNYEHVDKSCHEMEGLLNSIRIVKYN